MCYDISFSTTVETIEKYLPEEAEPGIEPVRQLLIEFGDQAHVMAQSFRKYPIITFDRGQYHIKLFEWGVIADYMNTPDKVKQLRSGMCNARSEKILDDKKSYWHRIRHQRCLIPVTGIFEHREVKGLKNKVPYFIKPKDRELFCIPGLYNYAPTPDMETGELKGTFTLITRAANSIMSQIHNCGDNAYRMPLFLPKDLELRWLDPSLTDAGIAEVLQHEVPSESLYHHTVYTIRSTKPRPDGKSKIDFFDWPNLPPLGMDEAGGSQASLF